jgi:thiol-disulfide isomerase/thioredoxin
MVIRRLQRVVPYALVLTALLAALLTACGDSPATARNNYVFNSRHATVQVDTPALRRQKDRAGISTCPTVPRGKPVVDGGLPPAVLPCLGGGPSVELASLRGQPTVINLWAQSCTPCRRESPILQRFHERAGDKVRVLGIDFQDSLPSLAIGFAAAYHLTYPQLADPDAALKAPLRVAGLPLTLFVTSGGRVARMHFGPVTSFGELETLVRRYLGVRV